METVGGRLSRLSLGFVLLAMALAGLAWLLPLRWPEYAAAGVFGAAAVSVGIEMILGRRAHFEARSGGRRPELYQGLAAQLYGLFFIGFGLLLAVGAGAAYLLGDNLDGWLDRLLRGPAAWGFVALVVGAILLLFGLIRLLAGAALEERGRLAGWQDLGQRLVGIWLIFLALIAGALGLGLILAPDAVAASGQGLVALLLRLIG